MDLNEIPHALEQGSTTIDDRDPVPMSDKNRVIWTWRLLLTMSVASFMLFSNGVLWAYASPAVSNLKQNRNPFRLTEEQQSWFGSLLCLGAAAGGLFSGPVCDLFGRKITMIGGSLFVVIGCTIMAGSVEANLFCVGYFIASCGGQVNWNAALIYASEVTPAAIRGTFMSIMFVAYAVGIVVTYAIGVPLAWNWLAIFGGAMYAAPNLVLVFLPESPRWFLMKGNREAAVHGIKWFRGGVCDFDEVHAIEESLPDSGGYTHNKLIDLIVVGDLFLIRRNFYSLFVCTMLFLFQAFSGNIVLQLFNTTIFEYVGATQIDTNMHTIISGLCLVVGSLLTPPLIDRIGRKWLLIASSAVVCLSMITATAFFQVLQTRPEYAHTYLYWLPIVGLSISNLSFSAGLMPIPFILSCEMFSTNVRGSAQTLLTVVMGMATFVATKTYINIQADIGNSGAFFIYAAISAVATLFVIVFVREAKQKVIC